MLFLHLSDAVIERFGDFRAHDLDLIGQDADVDSRFVHAAQMSIEVLARRMQCQADFFGDDPFVAGLFGQTVKQHRRHEMMMDIDDQFSCGHGFDAPCRQILG